MATRLAKAEYAREYRKNNLERHQGYDLKRKHGITLDDYKALLQEQGGSCAVCGTAPGTVGTGSKSKGTLAVDHCHETGTVRGLLCTNCNLGVGSFFEKPELLKNAALYLEEHRKLVTRILANQSRKAAEAKNIADECLKEISEM